MAIELCTQQTTHTVNRTWGIILAGGEGKRLKNFIKSKFGKECPKQFCAIIGSRSMFRHTIDRASLLISDDHLLTVVNSEHLHYALDDIRGRDRSTLVEIPANRETAPSILLPLLHIHKKDPSATVAIFPSDHFILEEDLFMDYVNAAIEFVRVTKEYLVTLAVTPFDIHPGYGWIKRGGVVHQSGKINFYSTQRFWEKPNEQESRELFHDGCLINTMIMVGKVHLLLNLFREFTPNLYSEGLRIKNALGKKNETNIIRDAFNAIPEINFSQAVLQHIPERLCVLPMNNVYWSDWGEEARIQTDLSRLWRHKKSSTTPFYFEKDLNTQQHTIEFISS